MASPAQTAAALYAKNEAATCNSHVYCPTCFQQMKEDRKICVLCAWLEHNDPIAYEDRQAKARR